MRWSREQYVESSKNYADYINLNYEQEYHEFPSFDAEQAMSR